SPILQSTYEQIARYIGQSLHLSTAFDTGQSLEEFANGQADMGFLCGLQYVRMTQWEDCPVELLAAPILLPDRYQNRPIYFSDVIVRRESPSASWEDLRGCTWAYNEPTSHSGYCLVCSCLLKRHQPLHYFGQWVPSGSHLNSLQMVLHGEADATAIDSHVLDVVSHRNPALAAQFRVIAQLGPSTMPPVVVAKQLDTVRKDQLRAALVAMHHDPVGRQHLHHGCIRCMAPINDEHYHDIRQMLATVQAVAWDPPTGCLPDSSPKPGHMKRDHSLGGDVPEYPYIDTRR
ncbi:MAG: PhnD/SsuA/transferrin family substrate-binding protein, partial [Ktedonobacteraceae bacterium]|nr:PhnD/SsuA/transferrin family substrate-binding protein [Ktedonobacteraceae bacterium]